MSFGHSPQRTMLPWMRGRHCGWHILWEGWGCMPATVAADQMYHAYTDFLDGSHPINSYIEKHTQHCFFSAPKPLQSNQITTRIQSSRQSTFTRFSLRRVVDKHYQIDLKLILSHVSWWLLYECTWTWWLLRIGSETCASMIYKSWLVACQEFISILISGNTHSHSHNLRVTSLQQHFWWRISIRDTKPTWHFPKSNQQRNQPLIFCWPAQRPLPPIEAGGGGGRKWNNELPLSILGGQRASSNAILRSDMTEVACGHQHYKWTLACWAFRR